jgi:N-acetylglucosamine kinase-like BadF-type ATPase
VSTPLFAGVDGGGTKTAIVVVDADGNEIARDTTTTSNSAVIGHERAAATLRELIQTTAASCGATLPLQGIWCGLSGSDRPEDHRQLRPRLEDLAHELVMTNDAELAIGGLPNRVGVAIVSGTGSIAFGRNAEGTRARAGGWGHIFGDQGSGYDVARQALFAFSAEADGYGQKTSLSERFMTYWELSDPWTIINRVYDPHTTKGDIARLSRIVVDEAAKGDEVSQRIIEHTASDLARFARAAANRLQLYPDLSLALVGGMLIHVEPFRDLVVDDLRQDWRIDHVELVEDPALTAARSLASAWKGVTA